jgi:hypothetical protein
MHCCLLAVVYLPSDTYVWLLGKGLALHLLILALMLAGQVPCTYGSAPSLFE